jgi:cytochrome c
MEGQSEISAAAFAYLSRLIAAVMVANMLGGGLANAAGDATRGEVLYQGCQDCHSIEKNDVGPMHKGVVGRTSGTVPGYSYSPALRSAKIVWTEENLDKWLTDPQAFIPGTKMFYEVKNPQDRADLIAFLRERAR